MYLYTAIIASALLFVQVSGVKHYLKNLYTENERAIKSFVFGNKKYVSQQISLQYSNEYSSSQKIIETSLLPLESKAISLAKFGSFPLVGGALAIVDGKLLIVDRLGSFYQFNNDSLFKIDIKKLNNRLDDYILKSKGVFNTDSMRVHSVCYDKNAKKIYVSYTRYLDPTHNQFIISSILLNQSKLASIGDWTDIYKSDPIPSKYTSQSGAGRLLIDHQHLFFSVGYSDDELLDEAQNSSSSFGKIFDMDLNSKKINLFARGFRNTQGLTTDSDGNLLGTDQGPQGGDKVNLIQNGMNYGWPILSYGTSYGKYRYEYKGHLLANKINQFKEPIYAFVPSIGISSIVLIKDFDAAWDGDFLVGSLKAQSLYRMRLKNQKVIYVEPIWIGSRVRDISFYNHRVVLLTDDSKLIFLTIDNDMLNKNNKDTGLFFDKQISNCLRCHSFEPSNPTSAAPSLLHVYGREIGKDNYMHYSEGLENRQGRWDRNNLHQFLSNPTEFAPGTKMPNPGLNSKQVDQVVNLLESYH